MGVVISSTEVGVGCSCEITSCALTRETVAVTNSAAANIVAKSPAHKLTAPRDGVAIRLESVDKLLNGKYSIISSLATFVLRLSKSEWWYFGNLLLQCFAPISPIRHEY